MLPLPLTLFPVTSIASMVLSSEDSLIVIFPLSASTASLKDSEIFAETYSTVAGSAGFELDKEGLVLSIVVKLNAVVLEIPA